MPNFLKALMEETLVAKITPKTAREIETILRQNVFHSTLDWQTKEQLQEGIKLAYSIFRRSD